MAGKETRRTIELTEKELYFGKYPHWEHCEHCLKRLTNIDNAVYRNGRMYCDVKCAGERAIDNLVKTKGSK